MKQNREQRLEKLQEINVYERIKLSILKMKSKCQVDSTKRWIDLFYFKYKNSIKYYDLINYLHKAERECIN